MNFCALGGLPLSPQPFRRVLGHPGRFSGCGEYSLGVWGEEKKKIGRGFRGKGGIKKEHGRGMLRPRSNETRFA